MSRYVSLLMTLALVAGCTEAPPTPAMTGPSLQSGSSAPAASAEALAAGDLTQVSLEVPAMSCPLGCAPQVEKTLAGLPGVEAVHIDFATKRATCTLKDMDEFDAVGAVDALAKAGFEGSTKIE